MPKLVGDVLRTVLSVVRIVPGARSVVDLFDPPTPKSGPPPPRESDKSEAAEPVAVQPVYEPTAPEPVHIDVPVVLVAESADPEATEPPGPELHVDEPFTNYRRLRANEIIGQLEGRSPEELAAIELYEATHRKRQTVLKAVERQLVKASKAALRNR